MNNRLTRSACALFAILALMTALLPAVRAEGGTLYVTGYTITSLVYTRLSACLP